MLSYYFNRETGEWNFPTFTSPVCSDHLVLTKLQLLYHKDWLFSYKGETWIAANYCDLLVAFRLSSLNSENEEETITMFHLSTFLTKEEMLTHNLHLVRKEAIKMMEIEDEWQG